MEILERKSLLIFSDRDKRIFSTGCSGMSSSSEMLRLSICGLTDTNVFPNLRGERKDDRLLLREEGLEGVQGRGRSWEKEFS